MDSQYSPFDEVAENYDSYFSKSPIGVLQRKRVNLFLEEVIGNKSLNILEINCGTGEDALWLASKGNRVVATDASEKMIDIAQKKVEQHDYESSIYAKQVAFNGLKENFSPGSFDLVFSDFGGLNCVSNAELAALCNDAASLLKSGGGFIAVVMGRKCLWERVYFFGKGKFKKAFRRNTNHPVDLVLGDTTQQTWYYSPKEIQEIFSSHFKLRRMKPVGIAIPPSYLNPFFSRKKTFLTVLYKLESFLSFSFLSNYADHFFIELQKIK